MDAERRRTRDARLALAGLLGLSVLATWRWPTGW